jgi:hypothetical protein
VEDDTGVECDEAVGRGKEGVDVDLFDPALFDDEFAEADDEGVECIEVDGLRPRTPLRAVKILVFSI